jgi:hypothetical protein
MSTPIEIVVNVHGGVVQDVFCSAGGAEVIVVDWDTEGAGSGDPSVVAVETAKGEKRAVHVDRSKATPLVDLVGTDVEAALQAFQPEATIEPTDWRYILYDFDADELASSMLYSDYAEASADANELNDILVLKVALPACPAIEEEDE